MATPHDPTTRTDNPAAMPSVKPKGQTTKYSPEALQELEEKVEARRKHPELVPSMFLWKDFGEFCKGIWHLKMFSVVSTLAEKAMTFINRLLREELNLTTAACCYVER